MRKQPTKEISERNQKLGYVLTQTDNAAQQLNYAIANLRKAAGGDYTDSCKKLDDAIILMMEVRAFANSARLDMHKEYDLPY